MAWWVTNSPVFDLRTLRITGTSHRSTAQLAKEAGLVPSTNVLWMSTSDVEHRLEQDPWIRNARIARSLPGTVTVAVAERTPVAIVQPERWLVASDGTILGRAWKADRYPSFTVEGSMRPGMRLPVATQAFLVARALPASLRSEIGRIDGGARDDISMVLRTGTRILMGDTSALKEKVAAMAAVITWATVHGVEARYVDVGVPSAPALLPASAPPASGGASDKPSGAPPAGRPLGHSVTSGPRLRFEG